jgi:hypothetical protein
MNAGASTYAVPSPIEGSGTAWVLLGSWALSPARPTPIHPRHECRGLSALFGETHRGQQYTPALTLPQVRYGLSMLLLEVFCTLSVPSICRQVHRQ